MKKIITLIAAAAAFMAAVSCSSKKVDITGTWNVDTLYGETVPETLNAPQVILNEDMTYAGVTGVNNMMGEYTFADGAISFSEAALTKMMADSVSVAVEECYLKAISSAATASLENEVLTLKDAEGAVVMTLRK